VFQGILFAALSALTSQAITPESLPAAAPPALLLPAKTPLILAFADEVSSKTALKNAEIRFVVAEDLRIGDVLVIPKDTPAMGEVVHVQKSGFGGRGGELILAARYITYQDQRIALRCRKEQFRCSSGGQHDSLCRAGFPVHYRRRDRHSGRHARAGSDY
jgi:hypothetical protein